MQAKFRTFYGFSQTFTKVVFSVRQRLVNVIHKWLERKTLVGGVSTSHTEMAFSSQHGCLRFPVSGPFLHIFPCPSLNLSCLIAVN